MSCLRYCLCVCCLQIHSSCCVCNGTQPLHISFFHFPNVIFARSLPEMFAARHDMVQVACGCTAHTVLALPVAPQMFRCRGGGLTRVHSNASSKARAQDYKENTNSTPNKYQTQLARAYEVTSFLSTDCELNTNPCSRFLYSLGPLSYCNCIAIISSSLHSAVVFLVEQLI